MTDCTFIRDRVTSSESICTVAAVVSKLHHGERLIDIVASIQSTQRHIELNDFDGAVDVDLG